MADNLKLINLISKEECAKIVRKHLFLDHVKVIDYEIRYAPKNTIGFLGEYLNLTITIENPSNEAHNKYSYFVKSLPRNNKLQRDMLEETGIFEKETIIYKKLFEQLKKYGGNKWHPECYFTRPDILVLEDLLLSGYEHITERTKFTDEELKSVLKNLASMHSNSINYEEKTGINIGTTYGDILFETSIKNIGWLHAGLLSLKSVAEVHPKYQTEKYQKFISQQFIKKLEPIFKIVNESENFRNVLCHRDIWHKNIFFKYSSNNNEVSSLLIDFQICRYSPPALDVLLTVCINSKRQERQTKLDGFLKYYHNELTNELKKVGINVNDHLSWETFLKSCNYVKLVPIFYCGIIETLINLPKDLLHQVKIDNPEKYDYYMHVNRSEIVLSNIQKYDNYKHCVFDAVEDIVDYIYDL